MSDQKKSGEGEGEKPKRRHHPLYPLPAHRRPHKKQSIHATEVKNEINVTPLVDVVLVLLIIFMVVTPMLSRGVKVELPETVNHEKKQDTGEQIVVSVTKDDKVYIDTDAVKLDEIEDRIRQKMKANPGRDIHVKADRRLDYGQVREVLEKLHAGGAPNVALGTEELKKEGT